MGQRFESSRAHHFTPEIQQKIAEAEKFAEEDKLRKTRVELRNQADSIIYQTRKTIEETGDKLSEEDTQPVLEKLDELENLIVKDDQPIPLEDIDDAAIQAKLAEIEQLMHGLSTKIYEAAAAEMAEQDSEGDSDDGVVEADFEVVDSDEENEES